MSDYTLAVNWSGKDALSDSDAAKVISGSDFNSEFTTVRTAVNSKADLNGDASEDFASNNATIAGNATIGGTLAVTGDATAPTQSAGNNTTKIATTAFVTTAANALNAAAYPVGAIFTTTVAYSNSAAVVAAIGGTTWTAFGAGKVLVGLDSSDTDFDTVEETGGAKTVSLTTANLAAHTHSAIFGVIPGENNPSNTNFKPVVSSTFTNTNQSVATDSTGSGTAHANVQPYIVVYMWKRTA